MFEKSLVAKLKAIFDLDKVTFDIPGESQEQEGAFIEVQKAVCKIKDARQIAHVTGKLHVFANADKMPYGFFTKAIDQALASSKQGLFFFDFEENKGTYRNISERSIGFVFLFDSQYDPAIGTITEVNLSLAES